MSLSPPAADRSPSTPPPSPRALGLTRFLVFLAGCGLLLGLGGCASVPNTEFLKHAYTTQRARTQFRNALGPVTRRQSDALMAELKKKEGSTDLLDRQVALEQAVSGAPLVLDNHVTLLLDGPATYQAMFAAMRQAQHTINVESYIITADETGQAFANILIERRAAGVEVNVVYDSVGAISTPKAFFDRLEAAGVRVVEFNPLNPLAVKKTKSWQPNHRDHRKLLIVDGHTAFLGGINIDSVYSSAPSGGSGRGHSGSSGFGGSGSSGGSSPEDEAKRERESGWRDTDIKVDGPVVADLQKTFLATWAKQHGPPLRREDYFPTVNPAGKDIVREIASSPDDAFSAIYLAVVAAIMHAEKQVYLTNAYFVPDPQLTQALLDAAHRGVDVRIILPGTSDATSVSYAAHSYYTTLLKGGVKIYERRGALLHAKTAVIDGVWTCVGSANLDWRSAVDNDELNAVILGPEFAKKMLDAYRQDLGQSDPIELDQWKKRPLADRLKETFFRLVGRFL